MNKDYIIRLHGKKLHDKPIRGMNKAIDLLISHAKKLGLELEAVDRMPWVDGYYNRLYERFGKQWFLHKEAVKVCKTTPETISTLFQVLRQQERIVTKLSDHDARIRVYHLS